MGYIGKDGQYHAEDAQMQDMVPGQTTSWKQSDHDRQRRDHQAELVQPWNNDGTVNDEFVSLYPEESKHVYKFIPTDEQISKEH